LRIGGKVSRPELLRHAYPETTAEARQHPGFNGTVILEANIDTQGNVISVRVLKEQPYGLTEAAVKSVKGWKFKPATLDGKPVTVYYVLTVNFKIGR
jgi:TonB family protein